MQVSRAMWAAVADLIAADAAYLSSATAMKVSLVVEAFVPALDLDLTSLSLAAASGLGTKDAGIGDAQAFTEPGVGGVTIQLLEPAGGWTWERTDSVDAAETIYGYVVTDTAGTGLIGSGLLPAPVTLSLAGHGISIDRIRCRFTESGLADPG